MWHRNEKLQKAGKNVTSEKKIFPNASFQTPLKTQDSTSRKKTQ